MDYTNPGFWIALGAGGSLAAALSAAQQYMAKEKEFRYRAVFRDFCIGAFLTAAVYMFLPESINKWISEAIPSFDTKLQSGGAPPASLSSDIALQVGPARF